MKILARCNKFIFTFAIVFVVACTSAREQVDNGNPTAVVISPTVTEELQPPESPDPTSKIIEPATPSLTSTPEDAAIETETPPLSFCDKFQIHLISATVKDEGNGWTRLIGEIAFENLGWSRTEFPTNSDLKDWKNSIYRFLQSIKIETNEGFVYEPDTLKVEIDFVPMGFRYRMQHPHEDGNLIFKVATGSTGRIAKLPCDTILDFDNPETDLVFPTELPSDSFVKIKTPIEFPEGTLTFTAVEDNGIPGEDLIMYIGGNIPPENATLIHYTFSNKSSGYGIDHLFFQAMYIADQGYIERPSGNGFSINNLGPSQTQNSQLIFRVKEKKFLIVERDLEYWIIDLNSQ